MFVSEKLIYLQLQKTGCNSSARIINQIAGGEQKRIHKQLDDFSTSLKIAGSVRNPWDWYVSLWSYGCANRGGLHNRLIHNRPFTITNSSRAIYDRLFKGVKAWEEVYKDVENPILFRKWLKMMMNEKNHKWLGEGYYTHPISKFGGFLTFRYCRLYFKDFSTKSIQTYRDFDSLIKSFPVEFALDYIIKTENLEYDTLNIMSDLGYKFDKELYMSKKMINKSKHNPPSFYYDDETIELVKKKDMIIVNKHHYDSPS